MKRGLFLLFVPFVAFATCEECQNLVSDLTLRVDNDLQLNGSNTVLATEGKVRLQYSLRNIELYHDNVNNALGYEAFISEYDSVTSGIYQAQDRLNLIHTHTEVIRSDLEIMKNQLTSFSCDCDSSSSCGCVAELVKIEGQLSSIESTISSIELNLIAFIDEITKEIIDGFYNVSNQLESINISIDSVLTNRYYYYHESSLYDHWNLRYIDYNTGTVYQGLTYSLKAGNSSILDAVKVMSENVSKDIYRLCNSFVYYTVKSFPVLTNTVGVLTQSSTNFFSFFRGEIGVHGVLEDWTEQDGSYHDFLTNHYIQVVTGGTLSGNQSAKTNWFSRIETLLASLVFTDSESTNTVDSSSAEQQASEITSHFSEISSSASTVSQNFSEQSQDIVELYRSWCQQFDNAALPSHVVLFTLPSEGEEIVVQFSLSDTPEIVAMVEGMRAITTFCWASVGIFLLYKFLVWSARCVFVACQFVYKAISAVFK